MEITEITVIVYQDAGWWCAQCREVDIATQAKTLGALGVELERVLQAHVAIATEWGLPPFSGLEVENWQAIDPRPVVAGSGRTASGSAPIAECI